MEVQEIDGIRKRPTCSKTKRRSPLRRQDERSDERRDERRDARDEKGEAKREARDERRDHKVRPDSRDGRCDRYDRGDERWEEPRLERWEDRREEPRHDAWGARRDDRLEERREERGHEFRREVRQDDWREPMYAHAAAQRPGDSRGFRGSPGQVCRSGRSPSDLAQSWPGHGRFANQEHSNGLRVDERMAFSGPQRGIGDERMASSGPQQGNIDSLRSTGPVPASAGQ